MVPELIGQGLAEMGHRLRRKPHQVKKKAPDLTEMEGKLLPIFGHHYFGTVPDEQNSSLKIADAVDVSLEHITTMQLKPGETFFLLWFTISSFFPLISACLSPLANLISLIGLIQSWRVEIATGKLVKDKHNLTALNALSFVFGVFGNASLLADFTGTIKYTISLLMAIFCFFAASMLLLADVLVTNKEFKGTDARYKRSEGFWFGVFTVFLYFCCSLLLAINFGGSKLKKYPPRFNLDHKQRTLMMYTICLSVWLMVGSIVMRHLEEDLTYGSSLYYCVVSLLTIGLGDIVPKSTGARVFALVFSFIGVLMIGLIVAMIRQVMLSSRGPMFFWHQVERHRVKHLQKVIESGQSMTSEQAFHDMRLIRKRAKIRQVNTSLMVSFTVFLIYWLVGGCVFHFTETSWNYFDAIYFCLLCLFTIGYGDYAPTSALGRVFFVIWAISAVPLMTILISSAGDKLFEVANIFSYILDKMFNVRAHLNRVVKRTHRAEEEHEDLTEDIVDDEEDEEEEIVESMMESGPETGKSNEIVDDLSTIQRDFSKNSYTGPAGSSAQPLSAHKKHRKSLTELLQFLTRLKPLISDSIDNPKKRYDHQYWKEYLDIVDSPRATTEHETDLYWLGDKSPLRLPLKEPNYLITKMFFKIESEIKHLIQEEIDWEQGK